MSSNHGHLDDDNRWGIYPTTGRPDQQLRAAADLAAQLFTASLTNWQNTFSGEQSENDHGLYRPIDEYDDGQPVNLALPRAQAQLFYQPLPYLSVADVEDVPSGQLSPTGQRDEDFWVNQVAPVQASTYQQPAWQQDESVTAPPPALVDDSDVWSPPVAPATWSSTQRIQDVEDAPAGNLQRQPDEDFLVAPGTATPWPQGLQLLQALPYLRGQDVEDAPAGNLQEQLDEDFWNAPSTSVPWPVQLTYFQQLPWALAPRDPEEVPAGNLQEQLDEDFWSLAGFPPAPAQLAYFQPAPLGFDDDLEDVPSGQLSPTGQRDEDLWQPPNLGPPFSAPAAFYQRQPYALSLWDPEELPAGQLSATGQRDEDLLTPPGTFPPWPLAQSFFQPLPLRDVEDLSLTVAHLQPDEDFWARPTTQLVYQAQMYAPDLDVSLIGPQLTADDDAFRMNTPATTTYVVAIYIDDPASPLFTPDEDPWWVGTQTAVSSPAPYLPAADAVDPLFTPEEDVQPLQLAPIPSANATQPGALGQVLGLDYQPDTDAVEFVPEEDVWQDLQPATWITPALIMDEGDLPSQQVMLTTLPDDAQPVMVAPQLWPLPPLGLWRLSFSGMDWPYVYQPTEGPSGSRSTAVVAFAGVSGSATMSGITSGVHDQPSSSSASQAQGSGSLAGVAGGGPTKAG